MKLSYIFTSDKDFILSKKNEIFVLIFILTLSFIVRFSGIENVGFQNDEAIYAGQAASLANYEEYQKHFSIFRAHPLLLQFFIALSFFLFGISEISARFIPVIFGSSIVILSYFIAKYLYNQRTAIISSLIIGLLPYHIIISKQVLVDVSLSFFLTLTLLLIIIFSRNNNTLVLYAIGISSGLSFLSKEIGILSLILSLLSLALINIKNINLKNMSILILTFVAVISPYWISFLTIIEARESIFNYAEWQFSRPPNHDYIYYFEILSGEILGYILFMITIIAYIYILSNKKIWNFKSMLLPFVWIPVPFIFYQLMSIKGYQFLYLITPFLVIFGISFLVSSRWKIKYYGILVPSIILLIMLSNNYVIYEYFLRIPHYPVLGSESSSYMKDAAIWIKENTPKDSTVLTLYTHMSNIIKFYSNRDSLALQSNNNPAYIQVSNPDLLIVSKIDYIVYEIMQLDNAKFLEKKAKKLESYIDKYNALPVYIKYVNTTDTSEPSSKPAIIVYSLT